MQNRDWHKNHAIKHNSSDTWAIYKELRNNVNIELRCQKPIILLERSMNFNNLMMLRAVGLSLTPVKGQSYRAYATCG